MASLQIVRRKNTVGKINQMPLYFMMIPAVIISLVYDYLPMYGIVMAFQNFNPAKGLFGPQEWVGLEKFTYFTNMPNFVPVMKNTLILSSLNILTHLTVPVLVALLLNEIGNSTFKRTVQTMIYLPHFLSWVILGGIFITLLSPSTGLVNKMLGLIGIDPIFFLGDNRWFRFTLVLTNTWQDFGWGTIIYLATITGIDMSLYEAAVMDGANRFQQARYITLPGIAHIWVMLMVLSLGKVLNAGFDQVFNLYSPLVYSTGDILDTFIYRIGLLQHRYSIGAAVGLFKACIGLVLVVSSRYLAFKITGRRAF